MLHYLDIGFFLQGKFNDLKSMKPHLLKINLASDHSFNIRYDVVPHFYNKWHYHPEIELVYIIEGSGQQFIGDNIHIFKPGDMLLLGPNLPHLWRTDKKSMKKGSPCRVKAIVLHFLPDCFGEGFFKLRENREIAKMLEDASQAIRIKNETRDEVAKLMRQLLTAKKSERIILLLRILTSIAESKQIRTVCNKGTLFQYTPAETERINNIYQYVLDNYYKKITLQQVSRIAHLGPHSFCRYFKMRTQKTFSRFLMEIRIGNACKLLAETDKSVAHICYECGYNSFSNFNRHFKMIAGRTPQAHRRFYYHLKKL